MRSADDDDRRALLDVYGWRCARCGAEPVRGELVVHHRLERSHGGDDLWPNRVPLCDPCHRWAHAEMDAAYACGLIVRSYLGPPRDPFGNPSTLSLLRPTLREQAEYLHADRLRRSPEMTDRNKELDESIGDGIGEILDRLGVETLDLTPAQKSALTIPDDPFAGLPSLEG